MKRCCIFGSAPINNYAWIGRLPDSDIVIAADGGLHHLNQLNRKPDYFVGDMDSLTDDIPAGIPIEQYPSEKDDTDTFIAAKKGLALGCDTFSFYGCSSGCLSHTLANIQLLLYLEKRGHSAVLLDENTEILTLSNRALSFDSARKGKVSVFSLSQQAVGVTIEGLKYPLNEAKLTNSFALGVSNEFIGKTSTIKVTNGDLLIILEK